MTDLENSFTQHGAQAFLGYTKTLVILIDSQGGLLEWNPAFDRLKAALPSAARIQDFLGEASRTFFTEMLQAQGPRQARLDPLPEAGGNELNCLVTPLPAGKFLICAEPCQASGEAFAHLTEELNQARRSLRIKKIELESVLAQADEISHTDSLTFLSNRRRIIADLQREVSGCDRHHRPLTIFMADLDHFKQINDTYGHSAGDQVLKTVSSQMLAKIRQTDKLGRYGGEEFLFILPDTTRKSSQVLADRLLKIIRSFEVNVGGGQVINVTISMGIAQYRPGRESWDKLLDRADKALYASKAGGRDRWTVSVFSKKPAS